MGRKAKVGYAMEPQQLEKVEVGEKVPDANGNPLVVLAACPAKNSGRWYCVTHEETFRNQLEKDVHITSGKHRMAWICIEHGVEVP